MVFQKPVLLRRSAAANISHALGLRGIARGDRASASATRSSLPDWKAARRRRRGCCPAASSSGCALARALSLEPEILLLDEPTASLDPASTLAIEQLLIDAQRRGIKIVVVTHDVGQARRLARDIVFLHHGRIVEHQAAKDFFDQPQSETARAFLAGGLVL